MSAIQPDLRGLAVLAQSRGRDLRPALLRVQAQEFALNPVRSRHAAAAFEAIALGLLPLVSAEVAAEIGAMLEGVPETPASVLQLIRRQAGERLGAGGAADDSARLDRARVLDGRELDDLVDRARSSAALARDLLGRDEPSAQQRAALFRFADARTRDRIRHDLKLRSAVSAEPAPILPATRRKRLLALARRGELAQLCAAIGKALKVAPQAITTLEDPAEAELFAVSLVAAGLDVEGCVQVFLTVDGDLRRSVSLVFHLAAICRATSPSVARNLVRCAFEPQEPPRRKPRAQPPVQADEPAPRGRAKARRIAGEPGVREIEAGRTAPDRARFAPTGRRLKSTTGRDRT